MRYWILIILLILTSIPSFADDVPDITQVARFGRGTAYTLAWRPDGEVLAVGSSTGVWFFDEDFNEVGNIPTDQTIDQIKWSPDGKWLALGRQATANSTCYTTISEISDDFESRVLAVPSICASSMDWRSDGEYLAIGTFDTELGNSEVVIFDSQLFAIQQHVDIGAYIAFSPDGQYLAINSNNTETPLTILDTITGETIQQTDDTEVFGEVKWSYDGNYLSTGCKFTDWEFSGTCSFVSSTGKLARSLHNIPSVSWSPADNRIISEGLFDYDGEYLVDLGSGTDNEIQIHSSQTFEYVYQMQWHPSGDYVTVLNKRLGIDGNLSNIEIESFTITEEKQLFSPSIRSIKWNPSNNTLLSTSNSAIFVWDWESNQGNVRVPILQIAKNTGARTQTVTQVRWVAENEFIAISLMSDRNNFKYHNRLHDALTGEVIDTPLYFYGYFDDFNFDGGLPLASWSNSLEQVAYTSFDDRETIIVADKLFAEDATFQFEVQADRLRQIEWSPDETMIATAGTVGEIDISHFLIEFWDAETGKIVSSMGLEWLQHYNQFIWNPDSSSIAVLSNRPTGGGCDMDVAIYPITFGDIYLPVPSVTAYFQAVEWGQNINRIRPYCRVPTATWSPDGLLIAVSFGNGVRIYNTQENTLLAEISTHWINTLDWHESGKYLAGGASDGTIYVWDVSALMGD